MLRLRELLHLKSFLFLTILRFVLRLDSFINFSFAYLMPRFVGDLYFQSRLTETGQILSAGSLEEMMRSSPLEWLLFVLEVLLTGLDWPVVLEHLLTI